MHEVSVPVAEDLDLDVAGLIHIPLDDERIVAERAQRFALRTGHRLGQRTGLAHNAHPLAATTCAGLHQHGEAEVERLRAERRVGLVGARVARHHRHTMHRDQLLRRLLAPHRGDRGRARAHEGDAGLFAGRRKLGPLRQEAVARMDGVGTCQLRRGDELLDDEVGLTRRRRADADRLVAGRHMGHVGIGIGEDRDGRDAKPARGAGNADRDLAPVGNQQFLNGCSVHEVTSFAAPAHSPRSAAVSDGRHPSSSFPRPAPSRRRRARGRRRCGCRAGR